MYKCAIPFLSIYQSVPSCYSLPTIYWGDEIFVPIQCQIRKFILQPYSLLSDYCSCLPVTDSSVYKCTISYRSYIRVYRAASRVQVSILVCALLQLASSSICVRTLESVEKLSATTMNRTTISVETRETYFQPSHKLS